MQNGFRTGIEQKLQLRVDPRLVLSGQLLEMNALEVRTAIEAELIENPAIDWLGDDGEPMYLETILKSINPGELRPSSEDREFHRSQPNDADELDWLDFAGTGNTLENCLEAQLTTLLPPRQHETARMVIGSLDDRGYLTAPAEEIALDHGLLMDDVEQVIEALHDAEPPGIGARDLRECLALQLRREDDLEGKLAYQIVRHCFDELVDRNVRALVRKFKVLPEIVERALARIQECKPYPADGFDRGGAPRDNSRGLGVPIDLHLRRTDQGWVVEVPGIDPRDLQISNAYRASLLRLHNCVHPDGDERRHLVTYIQRAKQFIEALELRGRTLRKVGHYLIEHQLGFVSTGDYAFLKDMTRRALAAGIGVHESTISRATTGKHLQLGSGQVVPFDVFFRPALRVQQMIAEILAGEDTDRPLSDERIAGILAERGVVVARRTVNKYRDRGKLLSSRRRRTA